MRAARVFSAVLTAVAMHARRGCASAAGKPNVLFLLADDWGWGDVGAYGANGPFALTGTNTRTPTLDALARNGSLFTDFHTGQAYCAPARTAFMTGKFPQDLSVNGNWNTGLSGAAANHAAGLPYQLPTPTGKGKGREWKGGLPNVASTLQAAGYATAHFGKWHLGGCSPAGEATPAPSEYGFDHTGTYGSPVYAGCVNATAKDEYASKSGKHQADTWWSADVGDYIRDKGIAHMTAAVKAGKPFYLNLWWHMSHDRIDPRPEQYNTTFPFRETCLFPATASCRAASGGTGCEPCNWQIFWGVQTYSDRFRFAPTIAAVDALGVRDNTYIIFSTDNGAQSERWTNNQGGSGPDGTTSGAFTNAVGTQGPFRGCKASLYDGGHRVPFIITGPGVPKSRIDDSLISGVDYFPTIAALAGAPIPTGTLLRGSNIADIWHGAVNHRTTRAKPLLWRGGGGPPPCWNRSPGLAVRNGDWKLLFSPRPQGDAQSAPVRVELYNMSSKGLGKEHGGAFFESQNLAKQFPEMVSSMLQQAMAWHTATPVPFGAANNTIPFSIRWAPSGCEAYPWPGTRRPPGPDAIVSSNMAGGDEADAELYRVNVAAHHQWRHRNVETIPAAVYPAAGGSEIEALRAEVARLRAELAICGAPSSAVLGKPSVATSLKNDDEANPAAGPFAGQFFSGVAADTEGARFLLLLEQDTYSGTP